MQLDAIYSPDLCLKIVDTQIQPILSYGCEVWYIGKTIDEIKNVSLSYMKSSLGVKIQTSLSMEKRGDFYFYLDSKGCFLNTGKY